MYKCTWSVVSVCVREGEFFVVIFSAGQYHDTPVRPFQDGRNLKDSFVPDVSMREESFQAKEECER